MDFAHDLGVDVDEENIDRMYLFFHVQKEGYGIQIGHVIEIVGMQRIVDVPDVPHYVKGVINLRGQVIPVIDVRARFKMPEAEYDDRTVIIVVEHKGVKTGFIVDGVSEVLELSENEISPPPQSAQQRNSMITGVGHKNEQICFLLSLDHMLTSSIEENSEAV